MAARPQQLIVIGILALLAGGPAAPGGPTASGYHSGGLEASGFHSGGLKASGYRSESLESSGVHSGGLKASGYRSGSLEASGVHSGGLKASGYRSGSLEASGFHSGGLKASGYRSGSLEASGVHSGGLKASGYLEQGGDPQPARRIVSLVPALTETLFAIGAGSQVAAVSSFDTFPPEVNALPRVGALLDPDTERILALRPDLVVLYGSQTDLQAQFARVGIQTYVYRHGGIATVLDSIRELGAVTGRSADAARLVRDLDARLAAVRQRVGGRPPPAVLLVFGRQPRTLREIYASGGRGFLHDMLEVAGGRNVFADAARESVQPSTEMILARRPEVILELRAEGLIAEREVARERDVWSTLSSVPAVRNRRVHFLSGDQFVVPGPRLADAAEAVARVLHPSAFE